MAESTNEMGHPQNELKRIAHRRTRRAAENISQLLAHCTPNGYGGVGPFRIKTA